MSYRKYVDKETSRQKPYHMIRILGQFFKKKDNARNHTDTRFSVSKRIAFKLPKGRFIIYPAYMVGCIFYYFSKMFRTPIGGRAICFVPLHGQSKNVSYPLHYNDVIRDRSINTGVGVSTVSVTASVFSH